MKDFKKLNRAEMRNVLGGTVAPPDGCGDNPEPCSSDSDCTTKQNPKCHFTTCQSTGKAFNFCGT